jgi:glycosyltransferase involved in cell wall biosynthesis
VTAAPKLVSVCVPTYNRAAILTQTLDTLLAQDYPNFELVVADNASTDETEAVCRGYAARDPRIRYHRNETNLGLIGNFNRVIELARGEYMVIAGDDDLYESHFLSRLVPVLDAEPQVVLSASGTDWIDPQGRPLVRSVDTYHADPARTPLEEAKRALWDARGTMMMGVYRTEVLRRSLRFQQTYKSSVDYCDSILVFELSMHGAIRWTPEILIHKRLGGISGQPMHRPFFFNVADLLAIGKRLRERLEHAPVSDPRMRRALSASIRWRVLRGFRDFWRPLVTSLLLGLMPPPLRTRFLARRRQSRERLVAPIQ